MGATSRILRHLLQSKVEDVPSGRLDRAVEALGVLGHLGAVPLPGGRDHLPPTENASCFPLLAGPVAALPVIEGRARHARLPTPGLRGTFEKCRMLLWTAKRTAKPRHSFPAKLSANAVKTSAGRDGPPLNKRRRY